MRKRRPSPGDFLKPKELVTLPRNIIKMTKFIRRGLEKLLSVCLLEAGRPPPEATELSLEGERKSMFFVQMTKQQKRRRSGSEPSSALCRPLRLAAASMAAANFTGPASEHDERKRKKEANSRGPTDRRLLCSRLPSGEHKTTTPRRHGTTARLTIRWKSGAAVGRRFCARPSRSRGCEWPLASHRKSGLDDNCHAFSLAARAPETMSRLGWRHQSKQNSS